MGAASPRQVFVGRERELAELTAALGAAVDGHGGLCLLVGEPGVGKTSLAERLCKEARERRIAVARGPCWEAGGAPAYWPWIQVLRALGREDQARAAPLVLGRGGADLGCLVPEVGDRLDASVAGEDAAVDSDRRRFELFDAVGAYLTASVAGAPALVVLEDLHAADEGSLLLLSFLARQLHDIALLVVATQRDVDVSPAAAVACQLADLGRTGRRLALRGLEDDDVAALIAAQTGAPASPELLASVQRVTGGNPFFVDEIVRVLAADGRLESGLTAREQMPLPDSVRVALDRRLAPLDRADRAVLQIAAVIGGEFRLGLLTECCAIDRPEVLARLEPALRLGVVRELPDAPGRYGFAHALIRETLVRELSAGARMLAHGTVADVLERQHAANLDDHLAALAFHSIEAAPVAVDGKAVHYARRAGERAARQLAYEDAARHFTQALSVLQATPDNGRERCELLLELGSAQRRAGATAEAKATFDEAARLASEQGAARLHARAVLGYAGALGGPGLAARTDGPTVAMLEDALDALGPTPTPERAQLLARLALELYYTPAVRRRAQLSQDAVDTAAATGDTRSRLIALYSRNWSTLGPDHADQRRRAADELLELARGSDDLEMRFSAHHFRVVNFLERGDLAGVDAELDACGHLADALHQPLYRWQHGLLQAMRALLQGRVDEGERFALAAYEAGRVVDEETAGNLLAAQLYDHRFVVGRLDELAGVIDEFALQRPWIPTWRCAAAFLRAEIGEPQAARAQLDAVGRRGFTDLPRDGNWSAGVALAAMAASTIGARDHAEALYALAAPVALRIVVVAAGDISIGPMALPAATLAATLGRWAEAVEHFAEADRLIARLDVRPMAAIAHRERARMLIARGAPGDARDAARECERALELARALGMQRLVVQVSRLLESIPAAARARSTAQAPRRTRIAVFERRGDAWRVGCEPSVTLLKHSKGMSHLAALLSAPGVEFRAVELAATGGRDGAAAGAAERARLNVTRALRGAIAQIAEHDAALGHELGGAIHTGAVARYTPAEALTWRVSPK